MKYTHIVKRIHKDDAYVTDDIIKSGMRIKVIEMLMLGNMWCHCDFIYYDKQKREYDRTFFYKVKLKKIAGT